MGIFRSEKSDVDDVEKNPAETGEASLPYADSSVSEGNAVPGESFEYGDSMYAKLQRLAGRMKIEQRGIERVPNSERDDTSLLNVGTMWLSANLVVSSFAIGLIGQVFGLGFVDAILTCLFFNILGALPVCYFSTFGPRFGLRQMVLSRFWFGWYGVKLIAIFNILACLGWACVNTIAGAQLIHAVNTDVPGWAGIIIIAILTAFICLFGYKIVHAYEFYSWAPNFVMFMIILGVFAHSGDFVNIPMGVGTSELGAVLSFGSVVYGFATGWTSYAADYTVYHPPTVSRRKIFIATFIGLIIPLLFTQFLAIAVMTATTINGGDNRYMDGYNESSTGGIMAAILFPADSYGATSLGTFGKFCLVILALSIIANNCPNLYSVALTMQVLGGRWFQRVPRFIWTIVCTGIYIAIAIPGYSHFETVLENFMNFIGYWLAIYTAISLTDHFLFRRGFSGYHPEHYDQRNRLPLGLAAVGAFCCGVVGMVTGMSQTWFVGPIAKKAADGDVGFELGFAFSLVSYIVLRWAELKVFKR